VEQSPTLYSLIMKWFWSEIHYTALVCTLLPYYTCSLRSLHTGSLKSTPVAQCRLTQYYCTHYCWPTITLPCRTNCQFPCKALNPFRKMSTSRYVISQNISSELCPRLWFCTTLWQNNISLGFRFNYNLVKISENSFLNHISVTDQFVPRRGH
jgi:hypothetical protein